MDRISAGDTVREAHLKFMSKSIQIKQKHILLDCNAVFNTRGEFTYARSVKRLCALSGHYRANFILIFYFIRILVTQDIFLYKNSHFLTILNSL
jgi:hypothetical protein